MRIFYLFLLNIFIANGQEIVLQGTLILNNHSLENIHIINLSNKKTAISDAHGKFTIEAKEDDLLVFSAIHIDYWRQSVKENDVKNKTITVKLTAKTQILEEVVVEQKVEMTAQETGIINYTPKSYTPAERRLRTANSGPIEIISSWITGKNKMLKKNIEIERNIKFQEQLLAFYNKDFFTETLKIPEIYRDGFIFYAVEMPEMIAALESKDPLKIKFMVSDLATDFLKYIEEK
jgi:hypothetical protein